MIDRVDLLIEILLDKTAREDERHEAAMDIGKYDDDRALAGLLKTASNPNEDTIILDACGESIGQIVVKRRNEFRKEDIEKLAPLARDIAEEYIYGHRPEWKPT
ncbi:MAG: hypothetical protein H0X51_08885 [Parachlamydiaceae bacterium]|nr:hypothetical protein [Parachlamydiaceae bacterium]